MSHTHVPLEIKRSHLVAWLLISSLLLTGTLILESVYQPDDIPQVLGAESSN